MKRGEATKRIEKVVANAAAGGEYARLADAIWVFGSYVAGALNVNDVDLVVEHRTNDALEQDVLRPFSYGGNPYRGLDRELRGTWRNVKVVFGRGTKESLERQGGFTFVLIYGAAATRCLSRSSDWLRSASTQMLGQHLVSM
jgi:hypothetical protein